MPIIVIAVNTFSAYAIHNFWIPAYFENAVFVLFPITWK